jgi:hypothetical protein
MVWDSELEIMRGLIGVLSKYFYLGMKKTKGNNSEQ